MTRTLIVLAMLAAGCEQLKSPQRLKDLEDRVDKLSTEVAAMKPGAGPPVRPGSGDPKKAGSGSGEGEGHGSDGDGKGSGEQVAAAEGSAHGEGGAAAGEGSAVPAEGGAHGEAAHGEGSAAGEAAHGEGSAAGGEGSAHGEAHGEGSAAEGSAAPSETREGGHEAADAGVPDAPLSKADQALADLKKVVSDMTGPGKRGEAKAKDGKGEAKTGDAKTGDAKTGDAKTSDAKTSDAKAKAAAQEPAPTGPARWSYEGKTGPPMWGTLDPAWATCQKGKMQSPIDIEPRAGTAKPIEFHYQPTPATIVDNGHTLQVKFASGSSIEIDGRRYGLLQMQFHSPSEHTIAGERYPLELDLVHQDDDGHIAVVGVLYDAGATSRSLAGVWSRWPRKVGVEDKLKKPFDPSELLPESRRVYRYTGSLTSPPCTEGVVWSVMRRAMTDSKAALDGFARHYPNNAREIQPRGDRKID